MSEDKSTPVWLSSELFQHALKNYFKNENIQVLKCASKPAIPLGENFTTDIFRTSITYAAGENEKQKTISVIVKCSPCNEMMLSVVQTMELFQKEAFIYNEVLPLINNALDTSEQVSAKCIDYVKSPNLVIILEDLSAMDFRTYPRRQGLDLQHCLIVVERLACFHAASAALYAKDSSPISKFTEGIYTKHPFIEDWTGVGFNALTEASAKWPGFEKYSMKLRKIKDERLDRILSAKRLRNFNVLNHGDCWINNFMFSYGDDGKLKDMRFVDFQLIVYGSPMLDLNYFWATSPNIEVRNQHFNTILDHYYSKLVATLTKLQHPSTEVPSKEELREDFNSRAFYGLTAAVTTLPVVAASSRNDATATLEDVVVNSSEEGFRQDSYNNERYRKYLEFLLPFYDNLGILD